MSYFPWFVVGVILNVGAIWFWMMRPVYRREQKEYEQIGAERHSDHFKRAVDDCKSFGIIVHCCGCGVWIIGAVDTFYPK